MTYHSSFKPSHSEFFRIKKVHKIFSNFKTLQNLNAKRHITYCKQILIIFQSLFGMLQLEKMITNIYLGCHKVPIFSRHFDSKWSIVHWIGGSNITKQTTASNSLLHSDGSSMDFPGIERVWVALFFKFLGFERVRVCIKMGPTNH